MSTPTPARPLFSVLVANHNHQALVGRAVDSVLQQDWPAEGREVVVVDDGSTDGSRDRLAAYAGQPGVTVIEQPNRGHTAAFAAALAHARGDFVCLLDADDTFLPHKLQRLAAHIGALGVGADRLFLCHDLQIVDGADGPPIADSWFGVAALDRLGPRLALPAAYHAFPFSVTSGMVYGGELLRRVMAEVPLWEWPMGADAIVGHTAMLITGEVHYLHERLGRYVVHGGNHLASVVDGRFRPKPVWQQRWPKQLRFLELLAARLPLSEREHAERSAYVGRLEHVTRSVSGGRRHSPPLLSFIVDATAAQRAAHAHATAAAIEQQLDRHHESIWLCDETTPATLPGDRRARRVQVEPGSDVFTRMQLGVQAARGGYLSFLDAGDLPDRRFVERHLQAHRFGTLPMLTASDLRLLDADGTVVQVGVLGAAAGWGTLPAEVQPFAAPLHEWALPPLPAIVLRRSALLDAFFDTPGLRLPDRHCGWLLAQYLLQCGGATRLAENLVDLRLPAGATPNRSWLAQFVDRHGPLPQPDLALCADELFAAYARTPGAQRACCTADWEAGFLRWLVRSGGAGVPARIEARLLEADDADWAGRVGATLRAIAAGSS